MARDRVYVINSTTFFNRELFMYAIGDIKFSKPISLKKVGYLLLFFMIWTAPILVIFGFSLNLFGLLLTFAPPIGMANLATKPVFGGKGLADFVKALIGYLQEPRGGWTDLSAKDQKAREVFNVDSEIWISRRRELKKLQRLSKGA